MPDSSLPADLPRDLHYVDDTQPGIRRKTLRGKFQYFDPKGERITDADEIKRLNALAVPPTVVQRGLDSHFVYRVNGDKVDVVPVQVTYQDSDVNIIKGVQAGDVLVSDGQSRLKAGAQVEILKEPPQVIQTVDAKVQP